MKIAVFHNYMDNIGGAEKVGLTLTSHLKADLYTTVVDREKIAKMGYSSNGIRSIGWVPSNAPFRQQLAFQRFRNLNLRKKYDHYIIDGDWAMSGAVNNKPNTWYVHSPIREIWDLYEYTRKNNVPMLARPVFDAWVRYMRYFNRKYAKHVGNIVCNSENTRRRIQKYLKRDAKVIYPPVDTSKYYHRKNGDFWLSVNRLITHKRVDMQLKAFAKMPNERLVIVGSYEKSRHFQSYAEYIKSICPPNVKILHWADEEELIRLYSECKGFITTSMDEDFGMTPVEAMASGKPVIAPNEGGYKESVIDGITGKLLDNIDTKKLCMAINEIGSNPESYRKECRKQAMRFDTSIFMKMMKEEINNGQRK